jgi:hypothetical protein
LTSHKDDATDVYNKQAPVVQPGLSVLLLDTDTA